MNPASTENVCGHLLITGKVQGVFFRAYARDQAVQLRLTGWVRNTADGKVEAVVEGSQDKVESFVTWCRLGPPSSQVTDMRVEKQEYRGEFKQFSVRY